MEPTLVPDAPVERIDLGDGAWVDVVRGWMANADVLYDVLTGQATWRQGKVFRYERYVDEPRLGATVALNPPLHPAILEAHRAVRAQWGKPFERPALAWYRDGNDSVAFHRDRDMRWLDNTLIALLTLGQQRPFLLRPRANRYAHEMDRHGATHDLSPASGDLLVMGGSCQAHWEHAVPKDPRKMSGRVSVQWRWTSKQGQPVVGASYRAPRTYSRR